MKVLRQIAGSIGVVLEKEPDDRAFGLPKPRYPVSAGLAGVSGDVKIRFVTDEKGNVAEVFLVSDTRSWLKRQRRRSQGEIQAYSNLGTIGTSHRDYYL